MFFRGGLRPMLINLISWKTLVLLVIIAVSLQTVNIGLSWWIQVISSRKSTLSKDNLSVHQQVSATYAEILGQVAQWSVLDSAGIFKFSLGIIRGTSSYKYSDKYYNDETRRIRQKNEDNGITLVTQCSLSRLHLLPELAKRWQGPLSVAVFLLAEEVQTGVQLFLKLQKCFPEIESNTTFSIVLPLSSSTTPFTTPTPHSTPCNQLFSSVSNVRNGNYNFSGVPYPNNLLRNVARKAIKTNFMLVLDIDMLPSRDLHSGFSNYVHKNNLAFKKGSSAREDDKTVWVVPSYEVKEGVQCPEDKGSLLRLRKTGAVRPFYEELCWKCQVCELHVAGYRFVVLDSAFVVHQGFKRTGDSHATKDDEQERNRMLFRHFKDNLKKKYPESSRRCY